MSAIKYIFQSLNTNDTCIYHCFCQYAYKSKYQSKQVIEMVQLDGSACQCADQVGTIYWQKVPNGVQHYEWPDILMSFGNTLKVFYPCTSFQGQGCVWRERHKHSSRFYGFTPDVCVQKVSLVSVDLNVGNQTKSLQAKISADYFQKIHVCV